MTPDDYRRAGDLFDELRQLPEAERAIALDSACSGNAELRAQVARMFAAEREADSDAFLQRRAIEDAARLLTPRASESLTSGTVVGNYRLGPCIGAGGMGVVFEGRDLRLDRRVAIKLLPLPFAAEGPERIRRFQREARAISLVNHPNIVSIFDAAFDQGHYYIAMEFVEGKTLRQLIASGSGPLDPETILDLIGQTASALSAAHETGIVHRDIKPENIMVRPDGIVKVLDFGLAKLLDPSSDPQNVVSDLRTRPGNLAGTIQYLSPEQVAGKPVTTRSDLFSLGVVAYELATGIRPFDGPTDGAVFEAILNRNPPPPSSVRLSAGSDLDRLIQQALEKDPDLRFQTASDLRSSCRRLSRDYVVKALQKEREVRGEDLAHGGVEERRAEPIAAIPAQPARSKRLWLIAVAAVVVAVAIVSARFWQERPAPSEHMLITRLTNSGLASRPAVSPDGVYVAYVNGEPGQDAIRLAHRATGSDIEVLRAGRGVIAHVAFSPDGNYLYYVRTQTSANDNGLFQIPVLGGNPKRLSALLDGPFSISHDGKFAAFSRQIGDTSVEEMVVLNLGTGESRIVHRRKNPDYFSSGSPAWSPDDRLLATAICSGNPCGLATIDLQSGAVRKMGRQDYNAINGAVWLPNGRRLIALIATRNSVMQVQLVDYPSGRTRPVTNDLDGYRGISMTADGSTLVTSLRQRSSFIWVADWHGAELGKPTQVTFGREGVMDGVGGLSWAKDGQIVFSGPDAEGWNIYAMKPGEKPRAITSGPYYNAELDVCPDGETVVFKSDRQKFFNLWTADLTTGRIRQLTLGTGEDAAPFCGPDGHTVFFDRRKEGLPVVYRVQLDGSGTTPLGTTRLSTLPVTTWNLAPNGKQYAAFDQVWMEAHNLVVADTESGAIIRSLPLPQSGHLPAASLSWTADSSAVLFAWQQSGISNVWMQPVAGGPPTQVTNFRSGLIWGLRNSRDGRHLAIARGSDTSDLVLIRHIFN